MFHRFLLLWVVLGSSGPEHSFLTNESDGNDRTMVKSFEHLSLGLTQDKFYLSLDCGAGLLTIAFELNFDFSIRRSTLRRSTPSHAILIFFNF